MFCLYVITLQAAASATTGGAARLTVTQSAERLSNPARLALGAWVGFCGVWVYSMVVLGGITRLTRSGLSMTEWKLTGKSMIVPHDGDVSIVTYSCLGLLPPGLAATAGAVALGTLIGVLGTCTGACA